jgi:hypothetical protein
MVCEKENENSFLGPKTQFLEPTSHLQLTEVWNSKSAGLRTIVIVGAWITRTQFNNILKLGVRPAKARLLAFSRLIIKQRFCCSFFRFIKLWTMRLETPLMFPIENFWKYSQDWIATWIAIWELRSVKKKIWTLLTLL